MFLEFSHELEKLRQDQERTTLQEKGELKQIFKHREKIRQQEYEKHRQQEKE